MPEIAARLGACRFEPGERGDRRLRPLTAAKLREVVDGGIEAVALGALRGLDWDLLTIADPAHNALVLALERLKLREREAS